MKRRPGFSLMEMMVVVAILVLIAGLSVPYFVGMLVDARIEASGDQLRARLAECRSNALKEGRPWRLAYLPNTGKYQLAPEESQHWDNVDTNIVQQAEVQRDELPEEIIITQDRDSILSQTQSAGAGNEWVTLAVYLSSGSARDDSTVYFGKAGQTPMRLTVRSITGTVMVEERSKVGNGS